MTRTPRRLPESSGTGANPAKAPICLLFKDPSSARQAMRVVAATAANAGDRGQDGVAPGQAFQVGVDGLMTVLLEGCDVHLEALVDPAGELTFEELYRSRRLSWFFRAVCSATALALAVTSSCMATRVCGAGARHAGDITAANIASTLASSRSVLAKMP